MINILITGATGFLGIHVLHEALRNNFKAFCIVRAKDYQAALKKIQNEYYYYFGEKIDNTLEDKLEIIVGDFSKEYFGLSYEEYMNLGNKISKVIHCGGLVKHFGKKDEFQKINVCGTRRVCEFSHQFNKYMFFSSSIAVKIRRIPDDYVKSKIEAERIIAEYTKKGMRSLIVRIGSLTGRYNDGVFQKNIQDNALYSRMKTILLSQSIPTEYLQKKVEFFPVDVCAQEIIETVKNECEGYLDFRNYCSTTYDKLLHFYLELGYLKKIEEFHDFTSYFRKMQELGLGKETITGFYLSMKRYENEKNLPNNSLSLKKDNALDVGKDYIEKITEHMKKVGFISE